MCSVISANPPYQSSPNQKQRKNHHHALQLPNPVAPGDNSLHLRSGTYRSSSLRSKSTLLKLPTLPKTILVFLPSPTQQQTCALNSIGASGCPVTNVTCICVAPTFISSFNSCVGTSCNATDQAGEFSSLPLPYLNFSLTWPPSPAATQFGIQYCAAAGVNLGAPSSTAAPAPAATTPASAPAATATAAVTTASDGQPESPTSASPSVSTFTGAAQPLMVPSGTYYGWGILAVLGVVVGGFVGV